MFVHAAAKVSFEPILLKKAGFGGVRKDPEKGFPIQSDWFRFVGWNGEQLRPFHAKCSSAALTDVAQRQLVEFMDQFRALVGGSITLIDWAESSLARASELKEDQRRSRRLDTYAQWWLGR